MHLVNKIAVDPERHTPSGLWRFVQVHFFLAKRKGNRVGIEEHKIGEVEARIDGQAQRLSVERARGRQVAHLQTDEIGSKQFRHASASLCIVCLVGVGLRVGLSLTQMLKNRLSKALRCIRV
jgi:hypothetical protein